MSNLADSIMIEPMKQPDGRPRKIMFYEPIYYDCINVPEGEIAPFFEVSLWNSDPYKTYYHNAVEYLSLEDLFGGTKTRVVLVPGKPGEGCNLFEISHLHCCYRYKPGKPYARLQSASILLGVEYPFSDRYDRQARWANEGFVDLEKIFSLLMEQAVVMPWKDGNTAIYNVKPLLSAARSPSIPQAAEKIDRNVAVTLRHLEIQFERRLEGLMTAWKKDEDLEDRCLELEKELADSRKKRARVSIG
jgi:hypothetical protein